MVKKLFFGVDHYGDEDGWLIGDNWLPYEEEEDLEGVFPYVHVWKREDRITVRIFYGNKARFESDINAYKNGVGNEILTIEEAKERGLDLKMWIRKVI